MKRIIDWFRSQYTISKLRIKAGDVLIVRVENGLNVDSNFSFLRTLGKALEKRNIKDTLVICVAGDCGLRGMSEEEMNKVGWFRKDTFTADAPGARKEVEL